MTAARHDRVRAVQVLDGQVSLGRAVMMRVRVVVAMMRVRVVVVMTLVRVVVVMMLARVVVVMMLARVRRARFAVAMANRVLVARA
jgi:hypothetical protein